MRPRQPHDNRGGSVTVKSSSAFRAEYARRMARHPRLSLVTRITFGCLAHGTSGVWRPTRERLSKVVGAPSRPSVLSDDQVNNALVKGAELGLLDELSEPELIILAGCRGAAGL